MSIGQGQDGDMTALLALHCRRKKGDCQRMLVIIRNKSSFDGVADRLPPLVVLIENMPAFHGGMLINDQHGPLKKRQFLSTRLIAVQQPPNGIAEPVWALIPAMGQQRIDRDMEPAIAKGLHAARYIHGWQNRLFRKAPASRRVPLAEFSQFQSGCFKLFHRLLQCLLQLVWIHLPAVCQGNQRAGLSEGIADQLLNPHHIPL